MHGFSDQTERNPCVIIITMQRFIWPTRPETNYCNVCNIFSIIKSNKTSIAAVLEPVCGRLQFHINSLTGTINSRDNRKQLRQKGCRVGERPPTLCTDKTESSIV